MDKKKLSAIFMSCCLALSLSACGNQNTPTASSASTSKAASVSSTKVKAQDLLAEQVVTTEMMATLEGAEWVSVNAESIVTGRVLKAGIDVALNNLVVQMMVDDDELGSDYLGLMNATDKARIAEVFLMMEGPPQSIKFAIATMHDTAAFNQRVATAASIVLNEKRTGSKKAATFQDFFNIAMTNTTTPPPGGQPPKPGDECYKGFPDVNTWNASSDLDYHFTEHAEDFGIDASIKTAESMKKYEIRAGNFLQDAIRAKGNGFVVRYRPSTGEIVVGQPSTQYFATFSKTGAAKTFYKWKSENGKTFADYMRDNSDTPDINAPENWDKGEKGIYDENMNCI